MWFFFCFVMKYKNVIFFIVLFEHISFCVNIIYTKRGKKNMGNEQKAVDIARYIINKCHENDFLISNLKLQKLLYFAQGYSLALNDEPLFKEEIEAWDFGPVVPEVYREFKMFGANEIPEIKTYYDTNFDSDTFLEEVEFTTDIFSEVQKVIMDAVIKQLGRFSANRLVTITHEQAPWINSYSKNSPSIISKKDIKTYFKGYLGK